MGAVCHSDEHCTVRADQVAIFSTAASTVSRGGPYRESRFDPSPTKAVSSASTGVLLVVLLGQFMHGLDESRHMVRIDPRRDSVSQVEDVPLARAKIRQNSADLLPNPLR